MAGTPLHPSDTTPFRGNPQYSIPITGTYVPAFVVSHAGGVTDYPGAPSSPPTIDSMSTLANPIAPTPQSIDDGRKYYQINCAVCHGAAGEGFRLMEYGIPAPPLVGARAEGLADGYYFGIMRNGRGFMPTYNRIEPVNRWEVVNYIRALQGKFGAKPDTSPAGYPGQNGPAVPGASWTAPTRSAPYRPQDIAAWRLPGIPPSPIPGLPPSAPPIPPATPGATTPGATPTDTTGHAPAPGPRPAPAPAPQGARP